MNGSLVWSVLPFLCRFLPSRCTALSLVVCALLTIITHTRSSFTLFLSLCLSFALCIELFVVAFACCAVLCRCRPTACCCRSSLFFPCCCSLLILSMVTVVSRCRALLVVSCLCRLCLLSSPCAYVSSSLSFSNLSSAFSF